MEFMEIFSPQTDWRIALLLMLLGIGAFILSTVSAGGGSLVLVPVLNWLIGVTNTAPVLNLGLDKEDLIATKTANSFLMGLSQIGGYAFFGLLQGKYWMYGFALA